MADNAKYLENSWSGRTTAAKEKALAAIEELKIKKEPVNFNTVHKLSGISKHFLYKNEAVRILIEAQRADEGRRNAAWKKKYDKTDKSKDVVIESKDRQIAKMGAEIERLRKEVNQLRAMIYANNK